MCGLLVDSIPNSENKHQKNCTADSQERSTIEIMKGLIQLCHCHHCRQVKTHHFFIQGMLVKQVLQR